MTEPVELKFSLNTLPHPGFKVCDGEVDPLRRWPAVSRKLYGNPDFRRFPPILNWWVDISLSFTQSKHYVLWQTLSPTWISMPLAGNRNERSTAHSDRVR